jgi:hypothetical protein
VRGEHGQVHRLDQLGLVEIQDGQAPGAAGRTVGALQRAALAGPHWLGLQEPGLHQGPHVPQRGRGRQVQAGRISALLTEFSARQDPDGDSLSYLWSLVARPGRGP